MDAPRYFLLEGDCREQLKELPDESIDSVVTDPPYDLTPTKNGSKGFMGKAWDATGIAFDPSLWADVLRVLKPGGHLAAFGGTRTYHRMAVAIEDAGFEIRDSIHWVQSRGFPKSQNISLMADKALGLQADRGKRFNNAGDHSLPAPARDYERYEPKSDFAKQWMGWGSALKPAHEPIVLARKPFKGPIILNVDAHGTGALNIDATRVPWADEADARAAASVAEGFTDARAQGSLTPSVSIGKESRDGTQSYFAEDLSGRWPPNFVLSHMEDCTEAACADGCAVVEMEDQRPGSSRFFPVFRYQPKAGAGEKYAYLTCDCETTTPAAWESADQSQQEKTGATSRLRATSEAPSTGAFGSSTSLSGSSDTGQFQPDSKSTIGTRTNPTTALRTSSSSARLSTSASTADVSFATGSGGSPASDAGLSSPSTESTGTSPKKAGLSTGVVVPATSEGLSKASVCERCGKARKRHQHPTQKPVELMAWLIKLVTPPDGVVLDPFTGSGSTGVAALKNGFRFVGIEREEEYQRIASARLEAANGR